MWPFSKCRLWIHQQQRFGRRLWLSQKGEVSEVTIMSRANLTGPALLEFRRILWRCAARQKSERSFAASLRRSGINLDDLSQQFLKDELKHTDRALKLLADVKSASSKNSN
jgi:hypothetical protein